MAPTYFPYLAAVRDADESAFTLSTSYRADPALVSAQNELFSRPSRPFIVEGIEYGPVSAEPGKKDSLTRANRPLPPFEIAFLEHEQDMGKQGKITKSWGGLPDRIAAHVSRWLGSKAKIAGREVGPGDFAILTRTNKQAAELQDALAKLGVKAVLLGDRSVLETPEANNVAIMMSALAEPTSERAVVTALTTPLFGRTINQTAELRDDEPGWERWIESFSRWHGLWERHGFIRAFRTLLREDEVARRLLSELGGERRLTNVLHLAELLHQVESSEKLGIAGLRRWFDDARRDPGLRGGVARDEHQLRLESDERAVKITTMHQSKGLEYPIVVCTHLWSSIASRDVRYHDPADGFREKLYLVAEKHSAERELSEVEDRAEDMRLAYVALTRARHAVSVIWGKFTGAENSPLATLLHAPDPGSGDARLGSQRVAAGSASMKRDLQRLASLGEGHISLAELSGAPGRPMSPSPDAKPSLSARTIARKVELSWRVSSFSALAAHGAPLSLPAEVGRDVDEGTATAALEADTTEAQPVLLHGFPRGAAAGDALHEILERVDFQRLDGEQTGPIVERALRRHAIDESWTPTVIQALGRVLDTPLDESRRLRLSERPAGAPTRGARVRLPGSPERSLPRGFQSRPGVRLRSRKSGSELRKRARKPGVCSASGISPGLRQSRVRGGGSLLGRRLQVELLGDRRARLRSVAPDSANGRAPLLPPIPPLHVGPGPIPPFEDRRLSLRARLWRSAVSVSSRHGPLSRKRHRRVSRPSAKGPNRSARRALFRSSFDMKRITLLRKHEYLAAIDSELARVLARLGPEEDSDVLLAAALASRGIREGDVCLDLRALAAKPLVDEEGEIIAGIAPPELELWKSKLSDSPLVSNGDRPTPLVLDPSSRLYLARYHQHETALALRLRELAVPAEIQSDDLRGALQRVFGPTPVQPDGQRTAAMIAVLRRLCVVSGGPGTGKTSTVVKILALLVEAGARRMQARLLAPTGKAAQRLSEAVQRAKAELDVDEKIKEAIVDEASTIHRALALQSRAPHSPDNPLRADVIVVDESSMVDLPLMRRLLDAVPVAARVVLLGDAHQLSSVEAGAVFGDICRVGQTSGFSLPSRLVRSRCSANPCPKAPKLRAPSPTRSSSSAGASDSNPRSGIGGLARAIHQGQVPRALELARAGGDLDLLELGLAELTPRLARLFVDRYSALVRASTPTEAFAELERFRLLTAHRKGLLGVERLNALAEKALAEAGLINLDSGRFYSGRPVLVTRNDYQVGLFNGNVGIVLSIDGVSRVHFPRAEGGARALVPSRLPEHETVFAMSIHKSQGSEFDEVAVVLPEPRSPLCTRELLYTAVTRARNRVQLFGSADSLAQGIGRPTRRASGLEDLL